MNEVERANREILIALLVDFHRDQADIPDLSDLKETFHLKMPNFLLDSSIEPWENQGWLIVSRTSEGTAARIKTARYSAAHARVLDYLGAGALEINWRKEEVLSDVAADDTVPLPSGWKWFSYGKEPSVPPPTQAQSLSIDSHSWTGLPSGFVFSSEKQDKLRQLLAQAEMKLETLDDLGNDRKAQIRAYLVAAASLNDAPEPQPDLIWELLQRGNNISGIAGFFVGLVGLFVALN